MTHIIVFAYLNELIHGQYRIPLTRKGQPDRRKLGAALGGAKIPKKYIRFGEIVENSFGSVTFPDYVMTDEIPEWRGI